VADLGPLYPITDEVISNTLETEHDFVKNLLSYAIQKDPDKVEIFQSLPTVMSPIGYADNRSICVDYLALIDDVHVGVEFQRQISTSNHDIDYKRRILANYCHTFASLIKKGSNNKIVPDLEFVTFMEQPLYKGKEVYLRSQLPIVAGYPDHIELLTDENIRMVIHYYQLSELNTEIMDNTPFNLMLAYLKAKTDQELNYISDNGDEILKNVVLNYKIYTKYLEKKKKFDHFFDKSPNEYQNIFNDFNSKLKRIKINSAQKIDLILQKDNNK
jgi:hypothetical protein